MSHWLLDKLKDTRQQALKQAEHAQIFQELFNTPSELDIELIHRTAEALEMVVLDLLIEDISDNENKQKDLKLAAADAFRLLRILPQPTEALDAGVLLLRAGTLAVLGDKGSDAARWMRENPWPDLPMDSEDWSKRTWATVLDIWLRLIRKNGWSDRDAVLERIARLRDAQSDFERDHLERKEPAHAKATALELIGLYHLAKAAEIFAYYITDGVVDGKYQIHQLLDTHFDRVIAVCKYAQMIDLEPLSWLLAASASQMAENSIWTVTRAVNSRVTQFVRNLVDRGRGDRAIFDVLPPQRRTLAERGLLGSSRRANHENMHVHGDKEEGSITTYFDMTVLNDLDRFHLVLDVINRLPTLGVSGVALKRMVQNTLVEHKQYVDKYGQDLPEIRNRKWGESK